jgi:hypothetical protein
MKALRSGRVGLVGRAELSIVDFVIVDLLIECEINQQIDNRKSPNRKSSDRPYPPHQTYPNVRQARVR